MGERNDLIDPDMSNQQMRLHFGEMTTQEISTARAAIRFANSRASTTIARLSEALAEAEKKGAEDWQPIETAPRDGTEFIAYREDQGLFACRWMSAEELAPKNWDGDPIGDYPEGRADWWHDVWGWLAGDEAPTLWQAYPAPPRNLSQGGQHG